MASDSTSTDSETPAVVQMLVKFRPYKPSSRFLDKLQHLVNEEPNMTLHIQVERDHSHDAIDVPHSKRPCTTGFSGGSRSGSRGTGGGSIRGSGGGSTRGSGGGSTRGSRGGSTRGSIRGSGTGSGSTRGSGGGSTRGSGGGSTRGSRGGSTRGSIRGSGTGSGSTRGSGGGSTRGSGSGSTRGSGGGSTRGTGSGSTRGSRGGRSSVGTSSTPRGYTTSDHPVLGGPGPCPHCFCSPCIVSNPPSFLVGSSAADIRNATKRFPLYRNFWGLLKDIGLWNYEPYLVRKSARTHRADVREIIPSCVINEIRRRYPNPVGVPYKDYESTFDAT